MFQTSVCRQFLGASPQTPKPLELIRNGGKQMKTGAKCCVSSKAWRQASAGLRPYPIPKGSASNLVRKLGVKMVEI